MKTRFLSAAIAAALLLPCSSVGAQDAEPAFAEAAEPGESIRGFLTELKQAGLTLEHRPALLSDELKADMQEVTNLFGPANIYALENRAGSWSVYVVEFASARTQQEFCRGLTLRHAPLAAVGTLVFTQFDPTPTRAPEWLKLAGFVASRRGSVVEFDPKREVNLLELPAQVKEISKQVKVFHAMARRYPWSDFDVSAQWAPLVQGGYLKAPIKNPLSSENAATKIAIGGERNETGVGFDPYVAGWIWNAVDKKLWPAGWDGAAWSARIKAVADVRMRRTIRSVRAITEAFLEQEGRTPWRPNGVAALQWRPLIVAKYLEGSPANPESPVEVATRIVEVKTPGATGTVTSPKHAGWVWNSADQRMFAAGRDD